MKTKQSVYMLLCTAMIIAFSCDKEGAQGPVGPQGEQGIQGEKGTANVIYSDWFTSDGQWNGYNTHNAYFDKEAPGITQDIYDHGDIRVYWKTGLKVAPLPAFTGNPGSVIIWNYKILETNFNIRIYVRYVDGSNIMPSLSNKFRYVIIPGGATARRSTPLPDYNDYHEVCEYYGIPE